MSDFLVPAQQAIFSRLTTAMVSVNVYDDVPALPEGQINANFPFIAIGDDTEGAWDTDDQLGATVTATIHVWSRYAGKEEAKLIMGQIYQALHRKADNLSAPGYHFIDCIHEFSQVFDQSDGATRHGVCRYRILMQKE